MVNKADDNPKILFTPYAWVPGALPYYAAPMPTHFVVLAVPFTAKLAITVGGNPYNKFFAQYPKQPRLLVIYDAIDDVQPNELVSPAVKTSLGDQMTELQAQFVGVVSWLVQPNAFQIKYLRSVFDKWHYSDQKFESLPEPPKATQFENQTVITTGK